MLSLPFSYIWLGFDVFTHFAMHYMLFGASFLVGLVMPRFKVLTAVALIGLSVAGIGAWARWPGEGNQLAQGQGPGMRQLRIMSFNSWLANRDWRAVANEIRARNPDIVTLVEFDRYKHPLLKALKRDWPYQADCNTVRYCHMAVLSKIPFKRVKSRTRWSGPPYMRIEYGPQLSNLRVFAIHTIRPPFFNAHLKQVRALSGEINRVKGMKIVMGDFNSTPFSRTLADFAAKTGLTRITSKPSWPSLAAGLPQIAIDHIFLTPDIKIVRYGYLGASAGSDHFPVNAVVNVAVKK